MQASTLLLDIHTVLKAASTKCKVIEESFPADFFEQSPAKIYSSYLKFIEGNVNTDDTDDKLALTTISQKFENNQYNSKKNGFYRLYHDINLVCTILIHYYPQGTRNYQMVDKFYKFATELLLRECYRIGITLIDSDIDENKDDEVSDLDKLIVNDFIKISTNYKVRVAETYHIKTRDMDLFSSLLAKSALDQRPRELPNNNFEVNKVIPQTNLREQAPKLGFIAANTSNIPDPTFPPTEMMTKFLHPNWYSLPTTTWLDYGDYRSWAPFCAEINTVSNASVRGKMWLERVGYNALFSNYYKENFENKEEPLETDIEEESLVVVDEGTKEAEEIQDKEISDAPINLENLLRWTPGNYISSEELTAFKEGKQSSLITSTLKELQRLRKNRTRENSVTKPSKEETRLYYRVKLLLRESILSKQQSRLPIVPTSTFPIIQANYNGGIPVVRSQPNKKRKYKK